jgi:GTP-binding protein
MRLIDKVRVEVRAGRGGDGIVAYTAHKLKRLLGPGMPCGGNGGRGGDISIVAKSNVRSLGSVPPVITAGNGGNGRKERVNGTAGEDIVVNVPVGVTVFDEEKKSIIMDLDKADQSVVVAVGGSGGRGNNRARPHERTMGEAGVKRKLILELKTIADIGLVGFPNAGKSSLLRFISRASPKVASYPFTTLAPFVGTVEVPGLENRVTVADLPGLVEEAHLNRGMGHEFLRHIERTKALLFVLDSTGQHWNPKEVSSMGSMEDILSVLRDEIELYDAQLAMKPWGVVVNKLDPEAGEADLARRLKAADALNSNLINSCPDTFKGLVSISAKYGIGQVALMQLIRKLMLRPNS